MKITAIFDIGKTNKKLCLFNEVLEIVHQRDVQIHESKDEDGYTCENLQEVENWILTNLQDVMNQTHYQVDCINISTYGASMVHVDHKGEPLTPLYNYLKPLPSKTLDSFYEKYGDKLTIARETASPPLGMLNSGLQLYWLKTSHPGIYSKIHWSFHLPQYFTYLMTKAVASDFTSVGCHTALWNFEKQDYHHWVYQEGIQRKLPPIIRTDTRFPQKFVENKTFEVGAGIHDSSACLIPYLKISPDPFLLISTGTWSISMNPYDETTLSTEDLQNDCLFFLQPDGRHVRASRFMLGRIHDCEVEKIEKSLGKTPRYHRAVRPDVKIINNLKSSAKEISVPKATRDNLPLMNWKSFASFEEAYHNLMYLLVTEQIRSSERAISKTEIKKIFIDGGFSGNAIFMYLLAEHFSDIDVYRAESAQGSALGAKVMVVRSQDDLTHLSSILRPQLVNRDALLSIT